MADFADAPPPELTPLVRATGQMFMVGFAGQEVTPQVRELIAKYHVGSVILSVKNLADAASTRRLILELQTIAHEAGHEHPLLISIDQENGMLNNLHDENYLTQFPGAMAMVATKNVKMARDVARASGAELKSLGINWIFGPVLDVLTNSTNRLLGVRTMGDDPQEVTKYGLAYIDGYNAGGLVSCGKHFPGYGNATVDSILGLPIVPESIEQLETASLIPFRQAVKHGIDAIMVGGCALPKIAVTEMHACLSEKVVNDLLRDDMGFDGVILSECLEMDALYENVGVRQGTVMAALAGCDMILVCSSHRLQREAISGIFGAVQSGIIDEDTIYQAAKRVFALKKKRLSWDEALNPKTLDYMKQLTVQHQLLSKTAYEHSVTLLRDHAKYIPLSQSVEPDGDIALLTPLVTPIITTKHDSSTNHLLLGETVFQEFGRSIAKLYSGKVLHASYTANGLMSMHDNIIERAQAVIVVTTDANRNMYQVGFSKHVSMICQQQRKPMIAVAASSPYDLALDRAIGTYLCLYEFTSEALDTAAKVLFGILPAKGIFPGTGLYQQRKDQSEKIKNKNKIKNNKNKWLVEIWQPDRDLKRLRTLWENCFPDRRVGPGLGMFSMLRNGPNSPDLIGSKDQVHFIVRNSSTNNLFGFCATWVYEEQGVGCICVICVDPSRRGMSIGTSLHDRAMKYFQEKGVHTVRIGSTIPSLFPGIPLNSQLSFGQWFQQMGWNIDTKQVRAIANKVYSQDGIDETSIFASPEDSDKLDPEDPADTPEVVRLASDSPISRRGSMANREDYDCKAITTLLVNPLQEWVPPKKLISELEMIGIKFDICLHDDRMDEVRALLGKFYKNANGLAELYEAAHAGGDAKIIIALDPVKNAVVGSLILFTRGSNIAGCMPWLLEFGDARVGGLCGLVIDPMYKDLTRVFTLGLVGCGVRQFKLQGFERCLIDGVTDYQASIYIENGFDVWRRYFQVSNPISNWQVSSS